MFSKTRSQIILLLCLPVILLLATGFALGSQPAIAAQPGPKTASQLSAQPASLFASLWPENITAPFACPAVAGYASSIEDTNFCVYYNNPPTTNAEATLVQGYVNDYWTRYDVDYGFLAPLFTAPKLEVRINGSSSCNGSAWDNYIDPYDGCFDSTMPEIMQFVTGHEVFHRVQFAHDPDWSTTWTNSGWIYEGTARNMEDVAFANIDTWADCLSAPFSYCDEVNDYLASTSQDITSFGMRYESNLFWTYFREQFGTILTEPQRGVDALVELWEQMATAESVAAVNNALAVLSPGTTFDDAFRQFTVANWTKDLTGLPDDSYNYADEDQAGNPAPYGPIVPLNGGTIDSVTSANWNAQSINRYSARYYVAAPAASCQVITANFQRTAGSTTFYHVITENGSAFGTHVEGSGDSWTQSFLNDGVTQVVAIVGGQGSSSTVNVTLSCATPVIDIELPNQLAPEYVGASGSPDNMVVQVSVTNGSPTGPIVGGLTNSDFDVEVGGLPALVVGGGFIQEEYFLLVDTPTQVANGPYDLEVSLEEPGTSTVIASDTENDAVIYDATNSDHVIVTDVSGSMGWDGKLFAAQNAANLFIDATNSSEGLGLVSYNHDVANTLGIQFATLPHRNSAHTQVNAYVASGATSIGDGLDEAVDLRNASTTSNARCQFTLLSDGMENSAAFWADVQADVVASGCPVTTIAFGPASNELLMQEIATATGGVSYYNDVYVSIGPSASPQSVTATPDDMEIGLGDSYLYSLCDSQNCKRLFTEDGLANYGDVFTHTMYIDDSVEEMSVVLDWRSTSLQDTNLDFALLLSSPGGQTYNTPDFSSAGSGHIGYHIADPEAGEWQLVVVYFNDIRNRGYQVSAYGQTERAVYLLLPDMDGYSTGDYVPLYAIWVPGGMVSATVTTLSGESQIIPLYDDGQHNDGQANDGFFAGRYTLAIESAAVPPVDEEGVPNPPEAEDEAAYRVRLLATYGEIRRETRGSFAVPAGEDENGDSIPDDFVAMRCAGVPNSDADLDQLDCTDEYYTGTDPNNSDTDGGGESDHSEAILNGLDALIPGDDMIDAPAFVQTTAQNGSVLLSYDVKPPYVNVIAYRSSDSAGPWLLINDDLPLTGIFTDTSVTNETTYRYCVQAADAADHHTAVVCSQPVTPRIDPVPPEAAMLINGGAISTTTTSVVLTFTPVEEGPEDIHNGQDAFSDITEVMLSNDPMFTDSTWQPFQQNIPWQLLPGTGQRTVYARFRDASGNVSVNVETATIWLEGGMGTLYLPIVIRQE
ncbi:MAG: vWA domain-containing protein [Chloroflexota bacterium]